MLDHSSNLLSALEQAKIRRGFCAPNPSVGAVIVGSDQTILAAGFHLAAGQPHAEVDALSKIKNIPSDAVMYVTLEPCSHFGRTPPCVNAIIASGIKTVYYGFKDPNPIVAGRGETKLREAGIACELILLPEIAEFYKSYHHWQQTKLPFITAKLAMTLDGKIAGKNSEPINITGPEINHYTHQLRKQHDAILTTVKTILNDDPQLNVRLQNEVIAKPLYILDRELKLPLSAKIFNSAKSITVFHDEAAQNEKKQLLTEKNVRCVAIPTNASGLNLQEVISQIGKDGIHDLWIEAGGKCFSSFLDEKLLHRALLYIAPNFLGEGLSAFHLNKNTIKKEIISWKQIGKDMLCELVFNDNN